MKPGSLRFAAISGCAALFLFGAVRSATSGPVPDPAIDSRASGEQSIVLAGGCFWGMQDVFQHVKGVRSTVAGYAGGDAEKAHYEMVSTGTTGHAESVKIVYDPAQISLGQLLKIYFSVAHDPTELNRQGPDSGSQYRSEIFVSTAEQKSVAETYIAQLEKAKVYPDKIVTKIEPLKGFYPAEAYHQNYAETHPDNMYIFLNDEPKVKALKEDFPALYVDKQG